MRRIITAIALLLSLVSLAQAQSTLSGLSAGSAVFGTDLFYDVQTPGTGGVKVTANQLATFQNSVVGTLTNKTFNTASNTLLVNGASVTALSGNTSTLATTQAPVANQCAGYDSSGNLAPQGGPCTTGGGGGTVSSGTTNQLGYYSSNGTTISGSQLVLLYTGNAATTAQVPQLPTATKNIANSGLVNTQCLSSGGGLLSSYRACTPGFSNLLRNSSLIDFPCSSGAGWEAGQNCSVTITTSGGWCAVGVWCIPVGGSIGCEWFSPGSGGGGDRILYCATGGSATDLKLRFVQESFLAQQMGGQTLTFQMRLQYTGASFTPTIATYYANNGDADDWSTNVAADLAAQSTQTCSQLDLGTGCYFGYTWNVGADVHYGYEETIDLNLTDSFAGAIAFYPGAWDMRITPEAPTGVALTIPLPEIRDPESDHLWDQRFYQIITSTDSVNGHTAYLPTAIATASTLASMPLQFPMMRTSPTITCSACSANQMSVGGNDVTSGSASNITPSSALLVLGASGGGLTAGNAYLVTIGTASAITLNADIPGG